MLGTPSSASNRIRRSRRTSTTNVAKLGVFAEPDAERETTYLQAFNDFETEIGRGADVYRTYRNWGQPLFNGTIRNILDPTKTSYAPPELYISFQAFGKTGAPIPWAGIAAGNYDSAIDSWSAELAKLGTHAYVCFHHEMETAQGVCGTPADFQAAYKHFRKRVGVFNGVTNLTWILTFMSSTFAGQLGGPDVWWAKGPQLVGVDGSNPFRCAGMPWMSLQQLIKPARDFAVAKGRRLFIGESGSVEGDACGGVLAHGTAKAAWYGDALSVMRSWSNLEAFCYNDAGSGEGPFYRIDTSSQALSAFRALAQDPLFG